MLNPRLQHYRKCNFKPIASGPRSLGGGSGKAGASSSGDNSGGKFFVQGSKMNTSNFDDGVEGETAW